MRERVIARKVSARAKLQAATTIARREIRDETFRRLMREDRFALAKLGRRLGTVVDIVVVKVEEALAIRFVHLPLRPLVE